jgi:hypothetical protein
MLKLSLLIIEIKTALRDVGRGVALLIIGIKITLIFLMGERCRCEVKKVVDVWPVFHLHYKAKHP